MMQMVKIANCIFLIQIDGRIFEAVPSLPLMTTSKYTPATELLKFDKIISKSSKRLEAALILSASAGSSTFSPDELSLACERIQIAAPTHNERIEYHCVRS